MMIDGRCAEAGCYFCRGSGDWTRCPNVLSAEESGLCLETFERLADKKPVTCIAPRSHWPKTAHVFGKEETCTQGESE